MSMRSSNASATPKPDKRKTMKKILLYGHGGAYNHGAEAILRTSIPLFRKAEVPIYLSTHFPDQDLEFGIDELVDRLIPADLSLVSEEKAQTDFAFREAAAARIYRAALAEIDQDTVCIGVGGDNYCYPNWHRQSVFHNTVKSRGGRSILWGCSIQPEMMTGQMLAVLRGHDQIYARESLTAQALYEHGIKQVVCRPDPAFSLQPQKTLLPREFAQNTAAFNLSPLALRKNKHLLPAFLQTAQLLLKHADRIMLLPHVTMTVDNDQKALKELESRLSVEERSRVFWAPPNLNAAQLKYLISKCSLMVCCRTHASIAGYSAGVPTLVMGYSIKSQGIALDLGMEHWLLPLEQYGSLPARTLELWESRDMVAQELFQNNQNGYSERTTLEGQ